MLVTKPPTTTVVDGWPVKTPNVAAHLNVDDPVSAPNLADWVQAGSEDKIVEYGGFFLPADIPPGSVINSITVRQHYRGNASPDEPGIRFALRVGGIERAAQGFGVDTSLVPTTGSAEFLGSGITRDELVGGTFTVEKKTYATPGDPPLPDG